MTAARVLGLVACLLAGSCSVAPPVCRSVEKARVEEVVAARTAALGLTADKILTLPDCEKIALENNLEYRVKLLETSRSVNRPVRARSRLVSGDGPPCGLVV